jgi:hypothetical protein
MRRFDVGTELTAFVAGIAFLTSRLGLMGRVDHLVKVSERNYYADSITKSTTEPTL